MLGVRCAFARALRDGEGLAWRLGVDDPVAGNLPVWAKAVGQRLAFFARERPGQGRALGEVLSRLRGVPAQGALRSFLDACLDLLAEEAETRANLASVRRELAVLCDLARVAIAADCDDRPVNERARPLSGLPGEAGAAASVPGRVVWLAAMAAQVPDEEGAAAVMLVNDLAALNPDLPLRALCAAARGGT